MPEIKLSSDTAAEIEKVASQFPERSQARSVLDEFVDGCVEFYKDDRDGLINAIGAAAYLIAEVRGSTNPPARADHVHAATLIQRLPEFERKKDQSGVLWRFPDALLAIANGTTSANYWWVDIDRLTEAVSLYLRQSAWHLNSPTLERIMASALAYQETLAFGEHLRDSALGRGILETIVAASVKDSAGEKIAARHSILDALKAILWALAAVAVGLGAATDFGWWAGILAAFAAFALFWFYRVSDKIIPYFARLRSSRLLSDMGTIANQIRKEPVSPRYVRQRLYDTSAKGAVWPTALVSIVEHACKRNSVEWR